jgi:hypothetical protein
VVGESRKIKGAMERPKPLDTFISAVNDELKRW